MCVNQPLSFDHGWWECGDKAAESGKDRWVAGMEGEGSVKGLGGRQPETVRDREEAVTLISVSGSSLQRFAFMCKK